MAAAQKVKQVVAACLTWKVRHKKGLKKDGELLDGLCVPNRQEIIIRAELLDRVDGYRTTLLHEFWHATLRHSQEYFNEPLIAILEVRLDEFLKNNPDIMRLYGYEQQRD